MLEWPGRPEGSGTAAPADEVALGRASGQTMSIPEGDEADQIADPREGGAAAGEPAAGADASVAAAIRAIVEGVDALAGLDYGELSGAALHGLVRELELSGRRLDGLRARLLTDVEADGRWATSGARSFAAWLRKTTQASAQHSWEQTRRSRALRDHLPLTREALAEGRIGSEHAAALAKHAVTTPARIEGLGHPEVGEAFLVEQAEQLDAGDFNRLVRRWAIAADPEASDRRWKEDVDREELVLARALDGYHLQGWLSDASGAAVDAALRARIGVPATGDTRTTAQRRATALTSLARLALDSGALASGSAIRPHLSVHVQYETLQRLAAAQRPDGAPADGTSSVSIPGWLDPAALRGAVPAELEDGTPLSPALLARFACDSELARVVFGPDSEILDSGRSKRLFTPGQRRAVVARDRRCQYPGCDAAPAEGEIHHSIWWYAQHGQTRAADGVLLCWFHHNHVHANAISIESTRNAGGVSASVGTPRTQPGWRFRDRNGRELAAGSPLSPAGALAPLGGFAAARSDSRATGGTDPP